MRLHNNQFRSKEYSRKLNDLVEEIMVEEFLHKIKELKQNYNNLENFRDAFLHALLQDYKKIIKYLDKCFCYNFKYDYDTAIVRDNSIGIVTHRDGDGICSTALLLRKCHNINAYFIKHNEINLIKNIKNKKIYIVDIRINGYIADYVNSLIKEGKEVKWFDHKTYFPQELLNNLKKDRVLILEDKSSASRLVSEYLNLNDEISKRICEIADACEKLKNKENETEGEIEENAIIINNLVCFGKVIIPQLVNELAKFGEVRSEKLKNISRNICLFKKEIN